MSEKYETLEKAILAWNSEDLTTFLMKSKHAMPVGTERVFSGKKYRKISVGNWQPISTIPDKDEPAAKNNGTHKPGMKDGKKVDDKKPHITVNITGDAEYEKHKKMLTAERAISEKQLKLIADLKKKGITNYKEDAEFKKLQQEKEDVMKKLKVDAKKYAEWKAKHTSKKENADSK